jgi:hypothetical protein
MAASAQTVSEWSGKTPEGEGRNLTRMSPAIQSASAFCPERGLFPAVGFALGGGSSITFVGCVANCIVQGCSRNCEIIPGRYRPSDKGRLDLLLHPSISTEALAAINAIAVQLRDGVISPEEAEAKVQEVAPAATGLFAGWTRAEKISATGLLIAALALLKPSAAPSVVVQPPVIERVIERMPDWMSSSALPRVPMPKPRPKDW